ncbi:lipoprotein [Acidovorax sp. sic0104]|uniref:LPS translocon maturation chaperone LptM n=1 Tax=Acidovorax sp. sic0104 TaxID=2854784 RepID=UPI001C459336|nr:lipoprotein [Acidovorax sp. sic0104]MBV7540005.1 lipoprotein [Acidovorax sp. sic0104]
MLKAPQILVRTLVLAASAAAIAGCGQRGPLYLPTDATAAQRATLPETLAPRSGAGRDSGASRMPAGPAPAAADAASAPR